MYPVHFGQLAIILTLIIIIIVVFKVNAGYEEICPFQINLEI